MSLYIQTQINTVRFARIQYQMILNSCSNISYISCNIAWIFVRPVIVSWITVSHAFLKNIYLILLGLSCGSWDLWSSLWHVGFLVGFLWDPVPWKGIDPPHRPQPHPPYWEHRVLATTSPGKLSFENTIQIKCLIYTLRFITDLAFFPLLIYWKCHKVKISKTFLT